MEYVDKYDNCDEQENNENDANDEPCGYACGSSVFDDSKLNVVGHIGPANDLCTLGQSCLRCCEFAIVCNAVYDPSGSVLCVVSNKCLDRSLKCSCIKAFNHCVTVGQLERTVGAAFCLNENETYEFSITQRERVSGENRTCGNGNGNFLIIISDCGVYNLDRYIVCGHYEGAFVAIDLLVENAGAVVKDLDLSGEAFLSGSSNLLTNGDILNGYVAVGVDVVVLVSACACEFNDTVVCKSCCDQIFIICVFSIVSKGLTGESSRPLISGLNSVDSGVKFNKYVLVQLVELVSRAQAGNVGELEGDFGLLVVYTEELDGFAAELSCKSSTCGNKACAIKQHPIPTVANYCGIIGKIEAENFSDNCIGVSVCSVFILANESAVDVVINNVLSNFLCVVLNGNCVAGHCEGEIACRGEFVGGAFERGLEVSVSGFAVYLESTGNDVSLFVVKTTDLCITCCGNGSDNGLDLVVANVEAIVFDSQQIFVNNGVVREVFSGEGYAFCGCCRFSNFFAICINEGHSTLGACCDTCERKCNNNTCVCAKGVVSLGSSTKVKCEVVSNCAAQFFVEVEVQISIRLVVEANNVATLCICVANELVQHCNVHNNLVHGCIRGKNEVLVIKNQIVQQCNGKLETDFVAPVSTLQDNGVSLLCICINGVILAVYQITNAYLGLFGLGLYGSGFFGSSYFGLFGSGVVTLHGSLQDNVLCGHVINDCTGCNVEPAVKVGIAVVVINHLGEVGAYGQEGCDNSVAVFVNEGSTVNVAYVNGDIEAGSDVSAVAKYRIQSHVDYFGKGFLAVVYSRYASCYCAKYLLKTLFKNYLCIKGNYLFKYECGIACVEVHEAVVCNNSTYSGSEQTVCNADSIALNEAVNSICIFYLINYCGVEVCERISGSCCILEQILQIEVITSYISELIDNVVNGVIEVAVNLCGQTVGDFLTGNCFELFYKVLKGRNVCKCIYKVLCFEVIREVIAGYSLNVGEKNLCVARGQYLIVCLAKESRVNCVENCNDLFQSQAFCKRDEIIGLLCVNGKNLILDGIYSRIAGVCHLFESNTENGCELSGNVDVCNKLAIVNADVANLVKQECELSGNTADEIYAGLENEVNVDFLGEDFSIVSFAFVVGDCKAYAKDLTAFVDVSELMYRGNEIFESIQQTYSVQLENVCALIGRSNYCTVELNLGNSGSNAVVNTKCSDEVSLKVELADKCLKNTGLVNNLNELLNVNLGYESANVDCSNETVDINNVGDFAVGDELLNDALNVESLNVVLNIHILNESLITAGNSRNNIFYTDFLNNSGVIDDARNNLISGNSTVLQLCLQLFLQYSSIEDYTVKRHTDKLILGKESNRLFVINQINQDICIKTHYKIGQLIGVILNQFLGIGVSDSLFDVCIADVAHQDVECTVFYVGFQVHALEQADETVLIYASKQFVSIKAANQLFYVDISNDCFYKSNDFFLGNDGKDFFLGQDIAETATGRNALEQTLNVSILHVGQKHLGINGNSNVGGRYVFNRCLVRLYAQPIFSKRTDRQNSQNSYEC